MITSGQELFSDFFLGVGMNESLRPGYRNGGYIVSVSVCF